MSESHRHKYLPPDKNGLREIDEGNDPDYWTKFRQTIMRDEMQAQANRLTVLQEIYLSGVRDPAGLLKLVPRDQWDRVEIEGKTLSHHKILLDRMSWRESLVAVWERIWARCNTA